VSGVNPEFDLRPARIETNKTVRAVMERDSLRAQRWNRTLEHGAIDVNVLSAPTQLARDSIGTIEIQIVKNKPSLLTVGTLVVGEVQGLSQCRIFEPGRSGASAMEVFPAGDDEKLTVSVQAPSNAETCVIQFRVVIPASAANSESEGVVHDIQIAIQ
jgi:hypothetical protein